MADTAEAPAKKKGKLPMIIALVAVLVGGGFFGMKMGGGKKEEPKVKIGKIADVGEFLVNLADGQTYLRAEISVHLADTLDPKKLEEEKAVVRDAIVLVLSSKTLADVTGAQAKASLKRELAAKINDRLQKGEEDGESDKKDNDKDKDEDEDDKDKEAEEPEHPEWDSDTGPVLRVYFTSFATQ